MFTLKAPAPLTKLPQKASVKAFVELREARFERSGVEGGIYEAFELIVLCIVVFVGYMGVFHVLS